MTSLTGHVIGIDFGTSVSVIGIAKRGGIETVLNEASSRQTRNLISFQQNQRFLGDAALPLSKSNYKHTVRNIKRFLGRIPFPSSELNPAIIPNYQSYNANTGKIKVYYNDGEKEFTAEQLTAMLLNRLRSTVDKKSLPEDVVLSVPGYWTEKQRYALLAACKIAGFVPLRLLNDHTATALSYGIFKSARNEFDVEKKQLVMFIDIGYANTSVSVVSFVQGKLEVISSAFDPNLGGRDFDLGIFDKFCDEFKAKHGLDVKSNAKAILKLIEACEKAKQTLTPDGVNLAKIQVEFLMEEIDFKSELSLEDFQAMSDGLLARFKLPLEQALKDAKVTVADLAAVEIIGGGSRPKIVKKALADYLGLDQTKQNYGLSTTLNLDEAISRGCALNAAMLSATFRVKPFDVFDAVIFPVTVSWQQDSIAESKMDIVNDNNDEDEIQVPASSQSNASNSVTVMPKGLRMPVSRRITLRKGKNFSMQANLDFEDQNDPLKKLLPENFNPKLADFLIKVESAKRPEKALDKDPVVKITFKMDINGLFKLESAKAIYEIAAPEPVEEKKGDEKKTEEKVEPPKKKLISVSIPVEEKYTYEFPASELKNFAEEEKVYAASDRKIEQTAEAKNALEAYIYTYRDKIDLSLKDFISDAERKDFSAKLSAEETWLYEDGYDVSQEEYRKRLDHLKSFGDLFDTRLYEFEERPKAEKDFRDLTNKYLEVINSVEERFDHITEEERQNVRQVIEKAEDWLQHQLHGQNKLKKSDDPVLTSALIREQLAKIKTVGHHIVTKKRPPPPKKEETKPEAEAKEENKEDNANMNTDEGGDKEDEDNEADPAMEVD